MDAAINPPGSTESGRVNPLSIRTCAAFISALTVLAVAMVALTLFVTIENPGCLPSLSSTLLLVGSIYAGAAIPGLWRRLREMRAGTGPRHG